jgi:hypothetical protein
MLKTVSSYASVIVCLFALVASGCKNTAANETSTPAADQDASGQGWGDTCVSCLCSISVWPGEMGYKKATDNPVGEYQEMRGFCQRRGACRWFEYGNFWSPPLMLARCLKSNQVTKWKDYKGGKLACFYENSFFGGAEKCYGPGDVWYIGDDWNDKISSIRLFGGARVKYWANFGYEGVMGEDSSQFVPQLIQPLKDQISSFKVY